MLDVVLEALMEALTAIVLSVADVVTAPGTNEDEVEPMKVYKMGWAAVNVLEELLQQLPPASTQQYRVLFALQL